MRLDDLTVEVRDKSLARRGLIRPEELSLDMEERFNNVGVWKTTLAAEHPLADILRTPGAGLIITGPGDVLLSGPVVKSEHTATPEDPGGSVVFEGVSDSVVLADMLAYPDPTNADGATQTLSHDVRHGPVETVMHAYVAANIGPLAPIQRRKTNLTLGPDLGRGPVVTKSARFPVLGQLLAELAALGDLGFRVVQRGGVLVFETRAIADRSDVIRLDVLNGTLSGQRVEVSPPGATRAIVAGQGELTSRQFLQVDTAASVAAEDEWGRRIERFVDQRNTDKPEELQQAGTQVMEEEGYTTIGAQVVPVDDSAMRLGVDWSLGDRVSVVAGGAELKSTATGVALKVGADGFRVGALLGDPTGFDRDAALSKRVTDTESRVSHLERSGEGGPRIASRSVVITPAAVASHVIWQAPRACSIVAVRGYRAGGLGATINAKAGGVDVLDLDLSLAVADSWLSSAPTGGASLEPGDSLAVAVRAVVGTPSAITIQVDYQEA
ncbi:siphovirus ReqiPepy6 Gp37-like family protein [Streptomyces sp. NPDC005963]|uniref:siphovirus ReqiPepy6 Gp37-like family protein n=1 Tax=Streptomyces sp. NPDC005963 TaxID=3156721 RepID=UPI0033E0CE4C